MKVLFAIALSLALLTGCAAGGAPEGYQRITQDEAKDVMASGEAFVLLDVRRPDEFAGGHIPGAMNLPNEEIGTDELPQLPDKAVTILVYCRSGNRSKQASAKLAALGYTDVREFGGINSWDGEIE